MPTTASGKTLIREHRASETALRAALLAQLLDLWSILDPLRIDATTTRWVDAVIELVLDYRERSARNGGTFYSHYRAAETGRRGLDIDYFTGLDQPNRDQIRYSLLATGPERIRHLVDRRDVDVAEAAERSLVTSSGAASRLVLNGGRDTIHTIAGADTTAVLWARATGPNPCAFCAMLASRGPVYFSKQIAYRTTENAPKRPPGVEYHDNCQCFPVPIFSADEPWPDGAREYEQLWKDVADPAPTGRKLAAFRKALRQRRTAAPSADDDAGSGEG